MSVETIREILSYDPETGHLSWLISPRYGIEVGARAGSQRADGYRAVRIYRKFYKEHRLAWVLMTGAWPIEEIDHKNGVKNDNRWANLREASHAENLQNVVQPIGASGFVGAVRRGNKWRAQISILGRNTYLGTFKTPEEASATYMAAKAMHHTFQPVDRRALGGVA